MNLIDLLKEFEGFRAHAYICPAGIRTIGYGHTTRSLNGPLSAQQAHDLLVSDIEHVRLAIKKIIPIDLKDYQEDALISFTFNVGAFALMRSTLRQKVLRKEHENASKEFLKWVHVKGIKTPGLVKRRGIEMALYQGLSYG